MDAKRRYALMRRWALALTVATAAFWIVWGLIFDAIPAVNDLGLAPSLVTINRFTDVVVAPVLAALIVFVLTIPKPGSEILDNFMDSRYVGLVVAVPIAVCQGFIWGLIAFIAAPLLIVALWCVLLALAAILAGFGSAIKFIFSWRTWQRFWRWLMVKG